MEIKTNQGETVSVASKRELHNVGNTNGRDVKCRRCREPWENCEVVDWNEDEIEKYVVLGAQLDDDELGEPTRIAYLDGCPGCVDEAS